MSAPMNRIIRFPVPSIISDCHPLQKEISVAQVSFSRKQLDWVLRDLSVREIKGRMPRSLRRNGKWLLAATTLSVLLAWNWQLVLATAAGIGSMALAYYLLEWDWQAWRTRWQHFFQGSQGKLSLAVGSGGLAALSTYIAAAIWSESENRWLAVGTILQGLATIATLLLLAWYAFSQGERQDEDKFERLLTGLTADGALDRLMAVRQLTSFANKTPRPAVYQVQLQEYFRLMLAKEVEPAVCEALLDSLQSWEVLPLRTKNQLGKPLQLPVNLQVSRKAVAAKLKQDG